MIHIKSERLHKKVKDKVNGMNECSLLLATLTRKTGYSSVDFDSF